ncbi:hypothetical protein ACWDTT_13565 [Streptosporangium sandarakinum]|uniref:hypothetical protein n=1 Tax=Streptosporangium TaxID=2000 RepID=UPI0031F8969B
MSLIKTATTGLIGLATAGAALSMSAPIPSANATTRLAVRTMADPAQSAPIARREVSTNASATARGGWYNIRHEALGPGTFLETRAWKRPAGDRVMQVKARCWGNDTRMYVKLYYRSRWHAEKLAKSGSWRCNGKYGIVRIHNAGHTWYWARFVLGKKHTVEYWAQYYK